MKYLFGPVVSRRLGVSLGVDVMPHKFCNMDCVYCEIGVTTNLISKRAECTPTKEIVAELDEYLSRNPKLNFITFSGCGEPTAHLGLSRIIQFIRKRYPRYKICLITNSTFLDFADEYLLDLDVVMPSLDSAVETTFTKINRAQKSFTAKKVIENLIDFRAKMRGQMWLEVFVVSGLNDTQNEIEALAEAIKKIKPHKVQLNTLDRPPTESWIKRPSFKTLGEIAKAFSPAKVEIVAKYPKLSFQREKEGSLSDDILENVKHRPLTKAELAENLHLKQSVLETMLTRLQTDGKISIESHQRGDFVRIKKSGGKL